MLQICSAFKPHAITHDSVKAVDEIFKVHDKLVNSETLIHISLLIIYAFEVAIETI